MTIGEIILSTILEAVFEKLLSTGVSLYLKQKKGNQSKVILSEWDDKLRLVEALLSDAEQKQFHSNAVKLWLLNLQDFVYDLEDILDEFATEARLHELSSNNLIDHELNAQHSRFGCSPFNKVRNLLANSSRAPTSRTANLSTRIKQISSRLQEILSQAASLGLTQQTQSREERLQEQVRLLETSSLVCGPVVYGRAKEREEIVEWLLKDDPSYESYSVSAVIGQGGIGKTTLVQCVYNDEQVVAHFDVKAWVYVSDIYDVHTITMSIINAITPDGSSSFSDLNQAQQKLKNLLTGKRFFIVLDDIWNDKYDQWDKLQTPLQNAEKGSGVIITTRIETVAKNMIKSPSQSLTVHLKGLSDDDCWLLFQQHALVDPKLLEMREDVTKLFKGLPLAAKALGGLLRKKDKTKWQKILKSNIWSEEGGVLPALRLSYHHLPPHLKRIFAYCSIFPKDHPFMEKEVTLMWIAEGFIQEDSEESMEDISHGYFFDMVSRSLFEPSPSGEGFFIMHYLIHDLAQWAAGDVCSKMDIHRVSGRTRYFSFTEEVENVSSQVRHSTPEKVDQLRTFAFYSRAHCHPPLKLLDIIIPQLQHLRLLSLPRMEITELPKSISNLKQLRHLDLSYTHIKELPDSTSNLCNLQMLLLKHCRFLQKVVTDIRHLDIDGTYRLKEMPTGIGKLTNLQTLNRFVLTPKSGPMIRELKNLKHLCGSLDISGLENVVESEDAQEARLHEKIGLEELCMSWDISNDGASDKIITDGLDQLQPHKSVKELSLICYGALTFPTWLGDPSFDTMVVIKLVKCFRCEFLPPLGQLPSLRELHIEKLHGIKTIGPEFYGVGCSNPFPALKAFGLWNMNSWEKWSHLQVDNMAFPSLENLTIAECRKLRGSFPPYLPCLRILKIRHCYQLSVSLPSCPLLQELMITWCKGLSNPSPVICCSESIRLDSISQFIEIEGFWVEGLQQLVVGDDGYLKRGAQKKQLEVINCPKLHTLWPDGYKELDKLTYVNLVNCEELTLFLEAKLPSCVKHLSIKSYHSLINTVNLITHCTILESLQIRECSSLITVDQLPLTLKRLDIRDCEKLQFVEFQEANSTNDMKLLLEEVDIYRCISLTSLFSRSLSKTPRTETSSSSILSLTEEDGPCELSHLTKLSLYECACSATLFPDSLLLPRIKDLSLAHCTNVEVLPNQVSKFTSLTRLNFVNVQTKLPAQEWGLHLLSSLEQLGLEDLGSSTDSVKCISGPDLGSCTNSVKCISGPDLFLPTSLSQLIIKGFESLKSISCSSLPNLTSLSIKKCPVVSFSDHNYLPPQLQEVSIHECPLLEQAI